MLQPSSFDNLNKKLFEKILIKQKQQPKQPKQLQQLQQQQQQQQQRNYNYN
jgi:hypothetical protein